MSAESKEIKIPKKAYMRKMRTLGNDVDTGSTGESQVSTPDTSSFKSSQSVSDLDATESVSGDVDYRTCLKSLSSPWTPPSWGSILSPGTPGAPSTPGALSTSGKPCKSQSKDIVRGQSNDESIHDFNHPVVGAPNIPDTSVGYIYSGERLHTVSGRLHSTTDLHRPTERLHSTTDLHRPTERLHSTTDLHRPTERLHSTTDLHRPTERLRTLSAEDLDSVFKDKSLFKTDPTAGQRSSDRHHQSSDRCPHPPTGGHHQSSDRCQHPSTTDRLHSLSSDTDSGIGDSPQTLSRLENRSHQLLRQHSDLGSLNTVDTSGIFSPVSKLLSQGKKLDCEAKSLVSSSTSQVTSLPRKHGKPRNRAHSQPTVSCDSSHDMLIEDISGVGEGKHIEQLLNPGQVADSHFTGSQDIKQEVIDIGYEQASSSTKIQVAEVGGTAQNLSVCQVCGDIAAGFHCGAFVCEACKKFFVRCVKSDQLKFTCPRTKSCLVTRETRTQCQACRYAKCLQLGMYRPGGANISSQISHIPCNVCGAPSSGYHFGAITCEGCKGFFRRTVKERDTAKYQCSRSNNCKITSTTRNICKFCRYRKCLDVGMKPDGSRIGRQPNAVKHVTMLQLQEIKIAKGIPVEFEVKPQPLLLKDVKEDITDDTEYQEQNTNEISPHKLELDNTVESTRHVTLDNQITSSHITHHLPTLLDSKSAPSSGQIDVTSSNQVTSGNQVTISTLADSGQVTRPTLNNSNQMTRLMRGSSVGQPTKSSPSLKLQMSVSHGHNTETLVSSREPNIKTIAPSHGHDPQHTNPLNKPEVSTELVTGNMPYSSNMPQSAPCPSSQSSLHKSYLQSPPRLSNPPGHLQSPPRLSNPPGHLQSPPHLSNPPSHLQSPPRLSNPPSHHQSPPRLSNPPGHLTSPPHLSNPPSHLQSPPHLSNPPIHHQSQFNPHPGRKSNLHSNSGSVPCLAIPHPVPPASTLSNLQTSPSVYNIHTSPPSHIHNSSNTQANYPPIVSDSSHLVPHLVPKATFDGNSDTIHHSVVHANSDTLAMLATSQSNSDTLAMLATSQSNSDTLAMLATSQSFTQHTRPCFSSESSVAFGNTRSSESLAGFGNTSYLVNLTSNIRPTGEHTGPTGGHTGPTGGHTGPTSGHSGPTGGHTGPTGGHTGPTGGHTGYSQVTAHHTSVPQHNTIPSSVHNTQPSPHHPHNTQPSPHHPSNTHPSSYLPSNSLSAPVNPYHANVPITHTDQSLQPQRNQSLEHTIQSKTPGYYLKESHPALEEMDVTTNPGAPVRYPQAPPTDGFVGLTKGPPSQAPAGLTKGPPTQAPVGLTKGPPTQAPVKCIKGLSPEDHSSGTPVRGSKDPKGGSASCVNCPEDPPLKPKQVLEMIQRAFKELEPVTKRCPEIPAHIVMGITLAEAWDIQMKQFSQCAHAMLKFAKKIPGFRKLPIQEQISRIQESMYPVVVVLLSADYHLSRRQYNYFNMNREEEEVILSLFPHFRPIIQCFHILGYSIQSCDLDKTEIALLCAFKLMSAVKEQYYEDILVDALNHYCIEKSGCLETLLTPSAATSRVGDILLRLTEMVRVNQIHTRCVISMSGMLVEEGLEIPQLFQESFLND